MFKEINDATSIIDAIVSTMDPAAVKSISDTASEYVQLLPATVILLIALWFSIMAYHRVQTITQVSPLEKQE